MSAADFYKENTLTVVCLMSPGGGFDFVSRVFASYWSNYAGGPAVVKNVTGGGGLVGQNFVSNAKPDGLTVGISNATFLLSPVLYDRPGVEYDVKNLSYVGGFCRAANLVFGVGVDLPYNSMADLQKVKGLRLGAQEPTNRITWVEAVTAEIFQLEDCRIILGFKGMTDAALAAAKGELEGVANKSNSYDEYVKKGWTKPPFLIFDRERDKDFAPDVPALPELVEIPPDLKPLFDFVVDFPAESSLGKLFFAPAGVPDDRLEFIRETFIKIYADAGAQKQFSLQYPVLAPPISGDDLGARMRTNVDEIAGMKETLTAMEQLVAKYTK
ncbi:Bug family tripartite tricarboxylate transporter substrate binding protein [Chloroflexota bacterium]